MHSVPVIDTPVTSQVEAGKQFQIGIDVADDPEAGYRIAVPLFDHSQVVIKDSVPGVTSILLKDRQVGWYIECRVDHPLVGIVTPADIPGRPRQGGTGSNGQVVVYDMIKIETSAQPRSEEHTSELQSRG